MITFDYQIIRRPRRHTASISVKPDCSVQVMVPTDLPMQKIVELVNRKSRWIKSKILLFQDINRDQKQKEYVSGESFTYLGRNYRLKITEGDSKDVKLADGRFYVSVPSIMTGNDKSEFIRRKLIEWYKEHAVQRLRQKAIRYAKVVGVQPVSVGLKDYLSRWGSCHQDGRLFFNWKVIIAPHSIVDYVVVHELCHLVYPDHSKEYWGLLETILPDYAERKEWLKVNGRLLNI